MNKQRARLFPALLKHWRGQRGMSQLDLALAASVSSKHISFLETGRAEPSEDMVLRLGATLSVPLRHQNVMLQAAGHEPAFAEPDFDAALTPEIEEALARMKEQQEPYPLVVMDRLYNVRDLNRGAAMLLHRFFPDPAALPTPLNGLLATFDPELLQTSIINFDELGRDLLWRLQREVLANPADRELADLAQKIAALPTVDENWKEPDLGTPSGPTVNVHFKRGDLEMKFFTMITAFNAPQNVTLEELRIESYFPVDSKTAELCRSLAQ